ncbi:MAG TPA: hypothetical protein PLI95_22710, partial [Polyangiaceae bacterium]|nr:hypothetical protein [Polyangiaceae bacterium]
MKHSERRTRILASLALAASMAFGSSVAHADIAAAEALFKEGRALMEKGETNAACDKFAESQRLDPSSGTLLNLGLCHEKQGKTATAWAEFLAAARLARTQGRADRAEEAQKRASDLQPKLSYLVITLASAAPGVEVFRGDTRLEQGALGTRIPVDPGKHVIKARAPGFREWTATVTVGPDSDSQTTVVPPLEPEPTAATPAASSATASVPTPATTTTAVAPSTPSGSSGPPTLAYVAGGLGVVALGVGATFGFMALSAYKSAEDACPTKAGCSPDAMDQRDKAGTRANIANVGIGLGIVGIGTAAVLLLTSSSSAPAQE